MSSTTPVEFRTKMKYTTQAIKLGSSDTLDLVVYEVKHNSKNDARISLSKEAFRMLADEMEDRALVIFVPEDNNDNYRFSLIEITLEVKDDSLVSHGIIATHAGIVISSGKALPITPPTST